MSWPFPTTMPRIPVRPEFPQCDNYEVQEATDLRSGFYSIHTETECVVSGLTEFQAISLMNHFKSMEQK
jgi:hypothetical protein